MFESKNNRIFKTIQAFQHSHFALSFAEDEKNGYQYDNSHGQMQIDSSSYLANQIK